MQVLDFQTCRLRAPDAPICTWDGDDCGTTMLDGPDLKDCPRFAIKDSHGATCPHCGTVLRHDPEYGVYACPAGCEGAWWPSLRELHADTAAVIRELRGELSFRVVHQSVGFSHARHVPTGYGVMGGGAA